MCNLGVDKWTISTSKFEKNDRDFYQSIFCQGNGYMGQRGFGPEEKKTSVYERGTFIAGFFEYIKPKITDMVNVSDFNSTRIHIDGVEVDHDKEIIEDFYQSINMKNGLFSRSFVLKLKDGKKTRITLERFFSQKDIHTAVIRYKITPLNHNGTLTFETGIDGEVANNPISDDQLTDNIDVIELLDIINSEVDEKNGYIFQQTKISGLKIAEAFCIEFSGFESCELKPVKRDGYIGNYIAATLEQNRTYIIDKFICVYNYRDVPENEILKQACSGAKQAMYKGFDCMLLESSEKWLEKWKYADIQIVGDDEVQGAIRYNIYQLIQTNAENDPGVSIGARGIMHGRYKGCYFWDTEIFMLPFYLFTNPKAARNLLMYRYNTMEAALKNAENLTLNGARFPWMSSASGLEQCETWDTGCCEVHITADVAYAIHNYVHTTGDNEFLINFGAEMLIQTARYWVSRFTYDFKDDVYNMLFVKGPNEYGGCTINNTYTNIMAVNNLKLAKNAVKLLEEEHTEDWRKLSHSLQFDKKELEKWDDIIQKVKINYDKKNQLYIEDDLFMKLEPLNINDCKTDDRALYHKISFDRLQRYRVLKQADILLLMTLFPNRFTEEQKLAAWNFYEPLTLHDSSLSFGTHAQLAAQLGIMDKANNYFYKSLFLDLHNLMENTGKEGVHFASFGAAWQAIVFGFAGLTYGENELKIVPRLPKGISLMKFSIFFRNEAWTVEIGLDGGKIERQPVCEKQAIV